MKRSVPLLGLLLSLSLLLSATAASRADISPTLNYQGRLTDASGNPVADGNYDLTFRIYDDPTGGTLQWASGGSAVSVPVANGLFSVVLGDGSMAALPEQIFTGQMLYLEIQIDGEPPFSPREPIVANAYSLRSNFAEEAHPWP